VADLIEIAEEVATALAAGRAVVALETTLVAHGFPAPEGVAVGLESERRVREAGAVPATVGVLDGAVRVGLTADDLHRFDAGARKLGPRDLAACAVQGAVGATTVGGTLAVARAIGIRFLGTGGLGGVHRGFPAPPDVSADLGELTRHQVVVVCSGVKSLLDVPATVELLETLSIPVLGFRTDTMPLFYSAHGGPAVSARVESPEEAARVAHAHWQLDRAALLVCRPPTESVEVEPLIEEAIAAAKRARVAGQSVTPFVLAYLHEHSAGETMRVNRELIAANAGLAGEVASAYSAL
jgi:pseudouridylate synthase